MNRVPFGALLSASSRLQRAASVPRPALSGIGYVGKAKPRTTATSDGKLPKATKADVAVWNDYISTLRQYLSALRAGTIQPSTPLPPAPSVPGTPALLKTANDLVTVTIPAAAAKAGYFAALKNPTSPSTQPSTGDSSGSSSSTSTTGSPATQPTSASTPQYSIVNGNYVDQNGNVIGPAAGYQPGTAAPSTPSVSVTAAATPQPAGTVPDPGTGMPTTTLPDGTIVDTSTGQPIQRSFLSNKYVLIGAGAVAIFLWWNSRRKR